MIKPLMLFVFALSAWAEGDPHEILKRFIAAQHENRIRARQYTFVEQADFFSFDKQGSKKDRSETHEVVFVEGAPYKKLVARNDRPLEAREQAKEDKKLRETAQERRKQQHSGLLRRNVRLGSDEDLLTLFDDRLVGEDEIRGRKVWVIECTPQPDRVPANSREKEAFSFATKLWIDQEDYLPLRSMKTVVGKHIVFMPGTVISIDFEKINQDAWLPVSMTIDGHLQFAKLIKPAVRTEYHNSRFQKFDVQSTISPEAK